MKYAAHIILFMLTTTIAAAQEPASLRDEYERRFAPSDYDPLPNARIHSQDTVGTPHPVSSDSAGSELEMVPGFRVQLLTSMDIDAVNYKKTEAESIFPNEWFYIEFEPPAYKLRAGNFTTRYDADRFARMLAERGFADAWSVPTRVFKSPPPVPVRPVLIVPADTAGAPADQQLPH